MADVTLAGPLFDGRAEAAAQRATVAIRHAVSAEGEKLASAAINESVRHGKGGKAVRAVTDTDVTRAYQTEKYTMPIVVDRDETIVTTDLAMYGPWLEGTGSRNETTRFKGYFSFRIATQELNLIAQGIADEALQPYLGEMQ